MQQKNLRYGLILLLTPTLLGSYAAAQCPDNFGFESGTFQNWVCSVGYVDQSGVVQMIANQQIASQHLLVDRNNHEVDPYGHFLLQSPNGSRYCVKLGNDNVGAQAERVSYTFTVPVNRNDYSIVYHYAVVFQNPNHFPFQQPRFAAKMFDIAANQYIPCSSFDFIASANLPGFQLSDAASNGGSQNVYFKPWALATIKIAGYAGKLLRLEFTTNDCIGGDHFGYAYFDVNETCNTAITGNVYCKGASSVKLTAPYGFEKYYWYNASLTTLLDSTGTLIIKPQPPDGSVYALIVKPYPGSGCLDTLFTTITYTNFTINLNVVDSANFCLPAVADLTASWVTAGSGAGLMYSYYTDSLQTNILQHPEAITANGLYYIKAANENGCVDTKPVQVSFSSSPAIVVNNPPALLYPATMDLTSPSLIAFSTTTIGLVISYWKNMATTIPLPTPNAVATQGTYYIKATNIYGCSDIKPVTVIVIIAKPPNVFTPNGDGINDTWEIAGLKQYVQCELDVFNRWGSLVFHSTGYSKPWDGTRKGSKLPAGTYYYFIKTSPLLKPTTGFVDILY